MRRNTEDHVMPTASANEHFESRAQSLLQGVKDSGQWKHLQTIESAMGPEMTLAGHGKVLCFCSNNYLGLANEDRVVQAGHEGLDRHGGGTASVRFICVHSLPTMNSSNASRHSLALRPATPSCRVGRQPRRCSQPCALRLTPSFPMS